MKLPLWITMTIGFTGTVIALSIVRDLRAPEPAVVVGCAHAPPIASVTTAGVDAAVLAKCIIDRANAGEDDISIARDCNTDIASVLGALWNAIDATTKATPAYHEMIAARRAMGLGLATDAGL